MDLRNPYEAPEAPIEPGHGPSEGGDSAPTAREVFLAWEKLRVVYNGILIAETLALGLYGLGWSRVTGFVFVGKAVLGAIGANVCFCAGPCFEGYLSLFGARRTAVRGLVFVPGMALAIVLAGFVIFM